MAVSAFTRARTAAGLPPSTLAPGVLALPLVAPALDLLGIAWRQSNPRNISIARREAVAALGEFVGPKR